MLQEVGKKKKQNRMMSWLFSWTATLGNLEYAGSSLLFLTMNEVLAFFRN